MKAGVGLIARPPQRRLRGLWCRAVGHSWANYAVFAQVKLGNGPWELVQHRAGMDVCRRCRGHNGVEIPLPETDEIRLEHIVCAADVA